MTIDDLRSKIEKLHRLAEDRSAPPNERANALESAANLQKRLAEAIRNQPPSAPPPAARPAEPQGSELHRSEGKPPGFRTAHTASSSKWSWVGKVLIAIVAIVVSRFVFRAVNDKPARNDEGLLASRIGDRGAGNLVAPATEVAPGGDHELPKQFQTHPYIAMSLSVGAPTAGWQLRAKPLRPNPELRIQEESLEHSYGLPSL
jgi:hypothetical protein